MTRKTIQTLRNEVSCYICGRTLLRGENTEVYLEGSERRVVCELCSPRARYAGWIHEAEADRLPARREPNDGRRSLLGRLRQRRGRRQEREPAAEAPDVRGQAWEEEPAHEEAAYDEAAYAEPAHEEPVYEEAAYEEPAYEEPAPQGHPAQPPAAAGYQQAPPPEHAAPEHYAEPGYEAAPAEAYHEEPVAEEYAAEPDYDEHAAYAQAPEQHAAAAPAAPAQHQAPPPPPVEEAAPDPRGSQAEPQRDPRARPTEPRDVYAVPMTDAMKMQRALEAFNASEHARTVASVARSLGKPLVSVRVDHERTGTVVIVVAWELSWYRFAVDLTDHAGAVGIVGRGDELSELSPEDREPNGTADEYGELALTTG